MLQSERNIPLKRIDGVRVRFNQMGNVLCAKQVTGTGGGYGIIQSFCVRPEPLNRICCNGKSLPAAFCIRR